jgi:serine/threonine-protein kinase
MLKKVFRSLSFLGNKRFLYIVGWTVGPFILLNYIVLPAYVNHGNTLIVPDLTGMSVDSARMVLQATGLELIEAGMRPDPQAPIGTVVSQNPSAGAVVKHGRRVYLTLSGGELLVSVPLLRGRSTRDAKFTLERSGLQLGAVEYGASNRYPENTIIDQSVSALSKVPKGTAVGLVVSRGRVAEDISVPDVVGKSVTEAEKALLLKGLKIGNTTYQTSFDLLPNTVVDQFPRAGDLVHEGQLVDLFVAKSGKPREEIEEKK